METTFYQGVQEATLPGNPDKWGIYVIRVKFPPHVMDRPHRHPNARSVTVLEGTGRANCWRGSGRLDAGRSQPVVLD